MKDKMNKIHHGDCLVFMRGVPDNYFDLVLTDPPFGMGFQSGYREEQHKKIANDDNLDWLPIFVKEIHRIAKKDAHLYLFCSHHFVDVFKQEIQKYRKVKNILIWEKNNTGMGDLEGDYAPKYEMILFCSSGERKLNGGRDASIIKASRTQNELHPTQKPTDLMEFLAKKSTQKGDKCFDPFMGSGTTAVACKSLGLDWCGCELEEDYVAIANKRLEAVQGSLF
jgi:site-specific DNA-methyltransferase (adenine-specific)